VYFCCDVLLSYLAYFSSCSWPALKIHILENCPARLPIRAALTSRERKSVPYHFQRQIQRQVSFQNLLLVNPSAQFPQAMALFLSLFLRADIR
jgi:hypothetical protein